MTDTPEKAGGIRPEEVEAAPGTNEKLEAARDRITQAKNDADRNRAEQQRARRDAEREARERLRRAEQEKAQREKNARQIAEEKQAIAEQARLQWREEQRNRQTRQAHAREDETTRRLNQSRAAAEEQLRAEQAELARRSAETDRLLGDISARLSARAAEEGPATGTTAEPRIPAAVSSPAEPHSPTGSPAAEPARPASAPASPNAPAAERLTIDSSAVRVHIAPSAPANPYTAPGYYVPVSPTAPVQNRSFTASAPGQTGQNSIYTPPAPGGMPVQNSVYTAPAPGSAPIQNIFSTAGHAPVSGTAPAPQRTPAPAAGMAAGGMADRGATVQVPLPWEQDSARRPGAAAQASSFVATTGSVPQSGDAQQLAGLQAQLREQRALLDEEKARYDRELEDLNRRYDQLRQNNAAAEEAEYLRQLNTVQDMRQRLAQEHAAHRAEIQTAMQTAADATARQISDPTAAEQMLRAVADEPARPVPAPSDESAGFSPVTEQMPTAQEPDTAGIGLSYDKYALRTLLRATEKKEVALRKSIAKKDRALKKASGAESVRLTVEKLELQKAVADGRTEDLRAAVSARSKPDVRRCKKRLRESLADYNATVADYENMTGNTLTRAQTSMPDAIVSGVPYTPLPTVVCRDPDALPQDTSPAGTRSERKERRREALEFARQQEQEDAELQRQLRTTGGEADTPDDRAAMRQLAAKEQMEHDRTMWQARYESRITALQGKAAISRYRFGGDEVARNAARHPGPAIRRLKKERDRAVKCARQDNARYYAVVCTDPSVAKVRRKKADRTRMEALRHRAEALLAERDELNARLLSFYTGGSEHPEKSKNGKKRMKTQLNAARRAYRSLAGDARRLEKMRVTRDRKDKVYEMMNRIIDLRGEIALQQYTLRREHLTAAVRRDIRQKIRVYEKQIREYRQDIQAGMGRAAKISRRSTNGRVQLFWLLLLLLLVAAGVLIYFFRAPIWNWLSGLFSPLTNGG